MSTSDFIRDNWLYITAGLGATLGITILSFVLATPIAMLTARGRRSALWPVKALSSLYVWLIEGVPLLLQIPFVYLALPQIGIVLSGFWGGIFVLTLNYGSHMSKFFPGALPPMEKAMAKPGLLSSNRLRMSLTA